MTTNIVTSCSQVALGVALGFVPGGSLGILASGYLFGRNTFNVIADAYTKAALVECAASTLYDAASSTPNSAWQAEFVAVPAIVLLGTGINQYFHYPASIHIHLHHDEF